VDREESFYIGQQGTTLKGQVVIPREGGKKGDGEDNSGGKG